MKDFTKRYCLALDLINDSDLIAKYEQYHKAVWPEITKSIKDAGIIKLEIYRIFNRLFMILEVNAEFSFARKQQMDANNPKVQEWERLMWNYQQAIPGAKSGEKWMLMDKIFDLDGR
jgi:L-rhamnose mutarotase